MFFTHGPKTIKNKWFLAKSAKNHLKQRGPPTPCRGVGGLQACSEQASQPLIGDGSCARHFWQGKGKAKLKSKFTLSLSEV